VDGTPKLFLSNSPEKFSGNLPITLYKAEFLKALALVTRIRAFVWHTNDTDSPVELKLLVSSNNGSVGTVSDIRFDDFVTAGDLTTSGICLAKAQLFGTLSQLGYTISFASNEATVWSKYLFPGDTAGCVIEFDVSALAAQLIRVRTVVTDWASEPEDWDQEPVASDVHPRGHWDHSEIVVPGGTFDATFGDLRTHELICCAANRAEEQAFPATLPYGKVNEGLFGVNLNYQFDVTREPSHPGSLHAAIMAMSTGKLYFGAAEISAWENRPDRYVPPIKYNDGSTRQTNVANLTQSGPLELAPFTNQVLNIRAANAGAATMPFLLLLSNMSLEVAP
jgi:hypothetical protein